MMQVYVILSSERLHAALRKSNICSVNVNMGSMQAYLQKLTEMLCLTSLPPHFLHYMRIIAVSLLHKHHDHVIMETCDNWSPAEMPSPRAHAVAATHNISVLCRRGQLCEDWQGARVGYL